MRVLIALHRFLPQSPYGAELYTYYLAKELQRCGHDVWLLFAEDREMEETRDCGGLRCTAVPLAESRRRHSGTPNPEVEARFDTILREFRPHVVHFNHLLNLSPHLPAAAKASGAAVVFTLHDYWLRCPAVKLLDRWGRLCDEATTWKCASCCRDRLSRMNWHATQNATQRGLSWVRRLAKEALFHLGERPLIAWRLRERERLLRQAVASVDRFIAPVRFMQRQMTQWNVPAERTCVCDYGTASLPYATRPLHSPDGRLRFGYLGATAEVKGLHVLLEAWRGLDDADLVIYGPPHSPMLGRFRDVLAQANVKLAGPIDDEEKARALPQLDALVVPSIWYENSPLVIHEAFAAGVPVICSGIGGMAELVTDGIDGLHFRVGDAADLRQVVLRCIAHPARLERLREGVCRPKSIREHVENEILPLYDELIQQPANEVPAPTLAVV